jgi:predicted nucleic acid-binding protein
MTLIFNASPIIVLAKAGLLDQLLPIHTQIWIPEPVATEISAIHNPVDPAAHWLATHSSLIHPATPLSPFLMAWDLGAGESAVISLSEQTPGSMVVLDDLAARRCAQALGLYVTGTIGLVLMAKRAGLIPSAAQALKAITNAGLYISQHHLVSILKQAEE